MKIASLHGAVYFVGDLPASVAWWSAVFGISPRRVTEVLAIFDVGGAEIVLHPRDGKSLVGGNQVLYWRVDSIEAALAELLIAGATVYRPIRVNEDGCQVCQVLSPDGIIIGLFQAQGTGNVLANGV